MTGSKGSAPARPRIRAALQPLPIDPLLPQVVSLTREHRALVVQAPPGAGKTTRIPLALLDSGLVRGEILVEQPRRLAARLAAARVAEELGEAVGKTIGYSVRFDERAGPDTRIRFVTEGVLLRRMLRDPRLEGVGAVVLDEFHERHLATDLALGLVNVLRVARPDLVVVVMSATVDGEPVATFLGGCPILVSEGRAFPIEVEHVEADVERGLPEAVSGAVARLTARQGDGEGQGAGAGGGDMLVFLPGSSEIRRAQEALQSLAERRNLLVLPLHGDLPPAEQDRAVHPADRRKVILSTNVAETSVTIDGVTAVIDSGLARVAAHSPWTGLPVLRVEKVSRASAIQRAGRAGRTRPGRAVRLYGRHDFETRAPYGMPDVQRLDLAEPLLTLHALGVRRPEAWAWFERPSDAALAAGNDLLRKLTAIDGAGDITDIGRRMLRFPVHPRLGRLLCEAEARGVGESGATLAALIGERDVRERSRVSFAGARSPRDGNAESADALEVLDLFEQAQAAGFARDRVRALGLEPRTVEAVDRVRGQLQRILREGDRGRQSETQRQEPRQSPDARDAALAQATLAGFPDRVARRRTSGANARSKSADATDSDEVVLAVGGSATVGASPPGDFLVVVDAIEHQGRSGRGHSPESARNKLRARLAVAIDPEAILEVCPDGVRDENELRWNPQNERVERIGRLTYGAVVLEESRKPAAPSAETAGVLLSAARAVGVAAWGDAERFERLAAQVALVRDTVGVDTLPSLDLDSIDRLLVEAAAAASSLGELRASDVLSLWRAALPPSAQSLLTQLPDRVRLPGGREVPVCYQTGTAPWIESRLQDFFGMKQGPSVLGGRVPLTLHLLAPNRRAVQVTQDLAGFWARHYPALRQQLSRRYPRHHWPEDGATAAPPPAHQGAARTNPRPR